MLKETHISSTLSENKELNEQINKLVEFVINNKILHFRLTDDFPFSTEILLREEILTKDESNDFQITNNRLFTYVYYIKYAQLVNFNITKDFQLTSDFLIDLENDLFSEKPVRHFSNLRRELWSLLILFSNDQFGNTFTDYVEKLDKTNVALFRFNDGLSIALPSLEIEVPELYKVLSKLFNLLSSDIAYNLPVFTLMNGISKINKSSLTSLFKFSKIQSPLVPDLLVATISGLFANSRLTFFKEELEPLMKDEKFSAAVISGLANVNDVSDEEAEEVLKAVNLLNLEIEDTLIHIPKIYFLIINSNNVTNEQLRKECFSKLSVLIRLENINLIFRILNGLSYIDNYKDEKLRLLLDLITTRHFNLETYLQKIDEIIWRTNDVSILREVLLAIAEARPFESVDEHLHLSIGELRFQQLNDFEQLVIDFLISYKGAIRSIGHDILHNISNPSYKFQYNILNLGGMEQYKLMISILSSFKEPKYILPPILPLGKSQYPIVKEAFICKLEIISEDFNKLLIDYLEQELDLKDEDYRILFERIKNYQEEFKSKNIALKRIKELNPFFTQYSLFKRYIENYDRILKSTVTKAAKEKSVISKIATEVVLAKGGGWKHESQDTVSKLSKTSVSFTLPRSYYVSPDRYEIELTNESRSDWNFKSKEWVAIALSLESI